MGEYVVKLRGAERMTSEACERELLGAYAAWQVGLEAVEPVAVTITPELVETLHGRDDWKAGERSIGLNVGSGFVQGMQEFVAGGRLTPAQLEQARLIFAFDVLIQNADRRAAKQNMLTDGERIVLLDHELAFSFTMDLMKMLRPSPEPWVIPDTDVHWIQNHYFFPLLRGAGFDFRTLAPQLHRLDGAFWEATRRHVPREWQTDQSARIETHLSHVLTNVEIFTTELNRLTQ